MTTTTAPPQAATDPDPWAPDPIPATLPHKPYTLPTIGTDPRPRHATDPPDDLDTWGARFEREHGPASVILQNHRTQQWADLATAYETNPRSFPDAWRYLDAHPIFYRFHTSPDGTDGTEPAQTIQERHLVGGEFGLYELYFKVTAWCAQRCEDDDCEHPAREICWLETGPYCWPGEHDDGYAGSSHDYRLDVYGESYESCIVQLAHKVWTLYGNDRALAHTANQSDESED